MIFLGAGASKPLGIPTMQELTDIMGKELDKEGLGTEFEAIKKCLQGYGLRPDFENIYSILESLINPREGILRAGPFTAYLCSTLHMGDLRSRPEIENVLHKMRRIIYDQCSKKLDTSKIDQLYKPLFHICTWDNIFTTNYDVSIEVYHQNNNIPLNDGTSRQENPLVKTFDPEIYKDKTSGFRKLVHLHGCVWLFKQNGTMIKTVVKPDDPNLPYKIDYVEEMMIYPTRLKDIMNYPYFELHELFRTELSNLIIAIGYSFRDDIINSIIIDHANRRPDLKLIIVDLDAEDIFRRIMMMNMKTRVYPIKRRFDDDNTAQEIQQGLAFFKV